ncbi:MAG: hypothetical protein V1806_13620 [Pseudomonadota bacterium]
MSGLAFRIICWTLALGLLAGCGGGSATAYYQQESLEQTPAQAMAFDGDVNEACFSDDNVDVSLRINNDDTTAFELDLTNKTGAPLVVRWDRVVFIDASGNRQYMVHQGVAYWDPLESLTPTSLAPQATLRDLLGPAKLSREDGTARLAPLSGPRDTSSYLDQRLRIDLPLEIYGQVNIYRFRFHVEQPLDGGPFLDRDQDYGP